MGIEGGTPRPLTPEGILGTRVTPDGKYVLARDSKRQMWFYPIAGGDPLKLDLALNADDNVLGFSQDGKSFLVSSGGIPRKVAWVELATGRRQPWKDIAPADPAGAQSIPLLKFSADGKSYAYSTLRVLSDLYVVGGLK